MRLATVNIENSFVFEDETNRKCLAAKPSAVYYNTITIPPTVKEIGPDFSRPLKGFAIDKIVIPPTVSYIHATAFDNLYINHIEFESVNNSNLKAPEGFTKNFPYILSDKIFNYFGEKSTVFSVAPDGNYLFEKIEEVYINSDFRCYSKKIGVSKNLKIMAINLPLYKSAFFDNITFDRRYTETEYELDEEGVEVPVAEVSCAYPFKIILWPDMIEKIKDTAFYLVHKDYIIPYDYRKINEIFKDIDTTNIHKTMTHHRTMEDLLDTAGVPFRKVNEYYSV